MALGAEDAGALQHQLHAGAVRQHHQLGAVGHVGVVGRRPRVVERDERRGGEVGRVHPLGLSGEVRLQQRRRREHEGDVDHGRREPAAVGGALARPVHGARVRAQPDREEEPPVHLLRHGGGVLRGGEAAELGRVVGDEARVVDLRQRRLQRREVLVEGRVRGRGRGVLVLEDAGHGGVVEGARPGGGVGRGQHVVGGAGVGRLGGEEHVGGLPGGDEDGVDGDGLDVDRVDVDDGEWVAGDGEEELVIERSVDDAEHVRLPGLHLQLERVCNAHHKYYYSNMHD